MQDLPGRTGKKGAFNYGLHSNERPASSPADPGSGHRSVPVRTHDQSRSSHCQALPIPSCGCFISVPKAAPAIPLPCSTSTIRQRRTGPCWKSPITAILWAPITETLESTNTVNVITGQPGDEDSVLYTLWSRFPGIKFFTADADGRLDMVSTVRVAE